VLELSFSNVDFMNDIFGKAQLIFFDQQVNNFTIS